MSLYSVDFFDRKLNFIYHDETEIDEIDMDYLTPETSSFDISQTTAVSVGHLVRLFGRNDFVAVVDSIQQHEGYTEISVKPFLSLFDQPVMFNAFWQKREDIYSRRTIKTNRGKNPHSKGWYEYNEETKEYTLTNDTEMQEGKTYYKRKKQDDYDPQTGKNTQEKSLEKMLKDLITQYFIDDNDSEQQMSISVTIPSDLGKEDLVDWTFNLVGDESGSKEDKPETDDNHCVVEFYDTLIQNALTQYRVAIESEYDFINKRINVNIGIPSGEKVFETNLPDLNVIEFTVGKLESDTNKLEIWNQDDYTATPVYYYLHTDGTYDTDGSQNRITPVKMEVISVMPEIEYTQISDTAGSNPFDEGWYEQTCSDPITYALTTDEEPEEEKQYFEKEINKSFEDVAKEQADQTFGDIQWRNYAEIEVLHESTYASDMKIGQIARIYNNGEWYESVLTGKKLSDVVTLVFGTIRIDMTKKNQLKDSEKYTDNKSVTKKSNNSSR